MQKLTKKKTKKVPRIKQIRKPQKPKKKNQKRKNQLKWKENVLFWNILDCFLHMKVLNSKKKIVKNKNIGLLKNICKNGLPVGDVFEYAAVHILRYEKKLKQKEFEKKKLSRSMEKIGIIYRFIRAIKILILYRSSQKRGRRKFKK